MALQAQLALARANAGRGVDHLLDVMRADIWPLLSDRTSITESEQERILGVDPSTGV